MQGTLARDVVQIESDFGRRYDGGSFGAGARVRHDAIGGHGRSSRCPVLRSYLSITIGRGGSAGLPIIVLYDAVPGGAGLVAHIEHTEVFRRSLEAAYRRVEGACDCGEDASCYGCLRSFATNLPIRNLSGDQLSGTLVLY